jgi:Glycosyl hydrolase family 9
MRWAVAILAVFCFPLFSSSLPAADSGIKILVNQAGYDLGASGCVLLQAGLFPDEIQTFDILREKRMIYRGSWGEPSEISGWNLWYRAAHLPLLSAGDYRVQVQWQGRPIESPPFRVGPSRIMRRTAPLAAYFFYAQRCGTEVPGWHGPCHLDDARLPDGRRIDLAGGWHDAGDYNKYNGYTPLAVYSLSRFAASAAAGAFPWPNDQPSPLEEALWGARWLRKCQDAGTKKIIGRVFSGFAFWGIPEAETDNVPGNEDDRPVDVGEWNENEMTVAAWASLSLASGDTEWLDLARDLWKVVEAHDPGSDPVQRAKRLLAAVELYRATGEASYQQGGQADAAFLLSLQRTDGSWPEWPMAIVDYGLVAASLARMALSFPESDVVALARQSLGRYLDLWSVRRLRPFSVPKWSENDLFYPGSPGEWYVGQNSMYLSQSWAGSLISQVLPNEEERVFPWISGCLDWILGINPFGICMMADAGSLHLPFYHHRYDRIPNGKAGRVPGAICNGITRLGIAQDLPYLDLEGNGWRTNEPWLPHNAYFLLTLAERHPWERDIRREKRNSAVNRAE